MNTYEIIAALTIPVAAAVAFAACGESIDSSSVKTDGVYADFSARADGSGQTKIHAGLKTGGPNSNTFLTLEEGDTLTFFVDGESKDPNTVDVLDQFEVYEKNVDKDAGGTEFKIEFTRENGTNAPDSSVTLPKKFQITAPSSGDSFSRSSDDVEVTIDNEDQGTNMRLVARGDCVDTNYRTEFSGTSFTIPSSELEDEEDSEAPDECEVTVTVRRTGTGQVDGAYSDGEFLGVQKRKATFTSTP